MTSNILELFAKRHSFYDINDNISVNTNVIDIVKEAMNIYPSSFNAQEARLVLLLGKRHKKLWDITKDKLISISSNEKHNNIKEKISSFSKGYGTILYFIDTLAVKEMEKKYTIYADNFMNWANQSNAMLQYMIWTALANNNIGASLQHYNPLIDEDIKNEFALPKHWQLIAQMPFGGINSVPKAHYVDKLEDKFVILE
jgi:predicted oxidoreductase (fatty acid repression mutant protein)